jgi:hypothetical protein
LTREGRASDPRAKIANRFSALFFSLKNDKTATTSNPHLLLSKNLDQLLNVEQSKRPSCFHLQSPQRTNMSDAKSGQNVDAKENVEQTVSRKTHFEDCGPQTSKKVNLSDTQQSLTVSAVSQAKNFGKVRGGSECCLWEFELFVLFCFFLPFFFFFFFLSLFLVRKCCFCSLRCRLLWGRKEFLSGCLLAPTTALLARRLQ